MPREPKKLWELEREFYTDLTENFWGCDGKVLIHRLPLPAGSPLDTGDQAIWHGVYTAMLALRYHVNSKTFDVTRYPEGDRTYSHLIEAAKGLQLHQTIHGETKPRLIRGVSDDLKTWEDNASNDSCTGHLLGIYFGWKYGPETMQPVFAQLAAGLAAELYNHDGCLVGVDGKATPYGALDNGFKTDPLRITLALAVYAVGATLCKATEFVNAYERLFRKYKPILAYPKVKLWWKENHNDTHRAAIHLAILADLTAGEPREIYKQGLGRIWQMTRKTANVWVNALCGFGIGESLGEHRDQAIKVLSEFTLKDKQFNEGRDNYKQLSGSLTPPWTWFKPILWNGKWMANQPLPRWSVRSQDFFWQRNLRSLDVGTEGHEADSRLNGGDYLAAYWLARLNGTLSDND